MKNQKIDCPCEDCEKDTSLDKKDYYMVYPSVWNEYGLGGGNCHLSDSGGVIEPKETGLLCMDCLEKRMVRKLVYSDILLCPVTFENPYTKKIILNFFASFNIKI